MTHTHGKDQRSLSSNVESGNGQTDGGDSITSHVNASVYMADTHNKT